MLGRRPAIAGEHHGTQASLAQFLDNRRGLRTDVIAQNHAAQQITGGNPDFRRAGTGLWGGKSARLHLRFHPLAFAEKHFDAVALGFQAFAGDGFKLRELDGGQSVLFAVARNGAGERMRG